MKTQDQCLVCNHINGATHLRRAETTLKSATRKCREYWPCKSMACDPCVGRRRLYFVTMGTLFAHLHELNLHVTISWPLKDQEHPWAKLLQCIDKLSSGAGGRIGKYIRTLAIGGKHTPHIHILISAAYYKKLHRIAKRHGPPETLIMPQDVFDVENLLGYFFDQNFLPTVNSSDRPKGVRVLSGSQGLSYGYPKTRHWKALALLNQKANGLIL